jgi:Rab GDP dissociation inhibitor
LIVCVAVLAGFDAQRQTMNELFDKYSLEDSTKTFTGHAMALQLDDSYLQQPAIHSIRAIQLYVYSLQR